MDLHGWDHLVPGPPRPGGLRWGRCAADVESGIPGNGYPFLGDVGGTPIAFDQYQPNAFFIANLGVVVLDEPVYGLGYAQLPGLGVVDTLGSGRNAAALTVVGYGLQRVRSNRGDPNFTIENRIRYKADLFIVDTKGVAGIGSIPGTDSMILSGDAKHGGTCFGDSGGPSFLPGTSTIVAVTSLV